MGDRYESAGEGSAAQAQLSAVRSAQRPPEPTVAVGAVKIETRLPALISSLATWTVTPWGC